MEREYMEKVMRRFWPKLNIPSDINQCWEWQGAPDKNGYGMIKVKVIRNGKQVFQNIRTHRLFWEYLNGDIPDGMIILHTCDNPPCCNPSHLILGTHQANAIDRNAKGRDNHAHGKTQSSPGESNPNSKLTEQQILDIRARYKAGGVSQQKLADEYGVTQAHISTITLNRTWRHI